MRDARCAGGFRQRHAGFINARDAGAGAHFDAEFFELQPRLAGQCFREHRQHAFAAFEQQHTRGV